MAPRLGSRNGQPQHQARGLVATQGPQQLKTDYQRRSAAHTDVHAKAQRDEVPVAFQDYVQRYFELVKSAPALAKRSTNAAIAFPRHSRTAR